MTPVDPDERLSVVLKWIRITLLSAASISLLLTGSAVIVTFVRNPSSLSLDRDSMIDYLILASPAVFFWGYLKEVLRGDEDREEWGIKPLLFHFSASLFHWAAGGALVILLALAETSLTGLVTLQLERLEQFSPHAIDDFLVALMGLAILVWIPLAASLSGIALVLLSLKRSGVIPGSPTGGPETIAPPDATESRAEGRS